MNNDWWTPSPMHGDGWYWCADTNAYENHWSLPPLLQRALWIGLGESYEQ